MTQKAKDLTFATVPLANGNYQIIALGKMDDGPHEIIMVTEPMGPYEMRKRANALRLVADAIDRIAQNDA